jgi:DegV family protein with EDD domain
VGLTSRASGTFQCGEAAAARSRTHGQIACVDTGNASLGQGLVALRAAEAAAAGAAIGEVERVARETARRTRTFACLATLEYAVRGGRVPRWARTLADTLHVMPLLATFPDGRISIGGALFGRRNLTAKFARFVRRRLPGGRRWRLAVGHANAAAEAQRLGTLIVEGRDDIELAYEVPIGTALGVHGGPGCLVVAAEEIAPA